MVMEAFEAGRTGCMHTWMLHGESGIPVNEICNQD